MFNPTRPKLFGAGRPRPLDREAKCKIMHRARALMRRTTAGNAYGAITAKTFAVLEALLWGFHNAKTGLCFPSYEKIAERAGCARSTVALAIATLEATGLLTWVNRIVRVRVAGGVRVIRTSNAYEFLGFSCQSDLETGTPAKNPSFDAHPSAEPCPSLTAALARWRTAAGFA